MNAKDQRRAMMLWRATALAESGSRNLCLRHLFAVLSGKLSVQHAGSSNISQRKCYKRLRLRTHLGHLGHLRAPRAGPTPVLCGSAQVQIKGNGDWMSFNRMQGVC